MSIREECSVFWIVDLDELWGFFLLFSIRIDKVDILDVVRLEDLMMGEEKYFFLLDFRDF